VDSCRRSEWLNRGKYFPSDLWICCIKKYSKRTVEKVRSICQKDDVQYILHLWTDALGSTVENHYEVRLLSLHVSSIFSPETTKYFNNLANHNNLSYFYSYYLLLYASMKIMTTSKKVSVDKRNQNGVHFFNTVCYRLFWFLRNKNWHWRCRLTKQWFLFVTLSKEPHTSLKGLCQYELLQTPVNSTGTARAASKFLSFLWSWESLADYESLLFISLSSIERKGLRC
jgi:hypothetical protein